jgi:hypothetical protein
MLIDGFLSCDSGGNLRMPDGSDLEDEIATGTSPLDIWKSSLWYQGYLLTDRNLSFLMGVSQGTPEPIPPVSEPPSVRNSEPGGTLISSSEGVGPDGSKYILQEYQRLDGSRYKVITSKYENGGNFSMQLGPDMFKSNEEIHQGSLADD